MTTRERLGELVAAAGVSGGEEPVAAVIERQLGRTPERDALGNRWLRLGPAGEPERLLIAHMDEIGLRVVSMRPDGRCNVEPVGGLDAQLWEGTEVVVHTARGPAPGCIAPVSLHVTGRGDGRLRADDLLLDVGGDARELGVALHDAVTWRKRLTDLPGGLVQGRSLDDRFGCAALVAIADAKPSVPTVLAWSVQEEVGLRGARALARRFPRCREVIAVDSFTIGGGPRDRTQYDGVRLGGGPVLRCWDRTTLLPDDARRTFLDTTRDLQTGYMPGGNDASVFEETGALVYGLGVALQYSHTAVERIHLGDLEALQDLLRRIVVS